MSRGAALWQTLRGRLSPSPQRAAGKLTPGEASAAGPPAPQGEASHLRLQPTVHRQFYPPEATVEVRPLAAAEPVRFTLWPTFEGGVGAYVPCAACVERAKRLSPREGVCRSSVRSFAQPERLKPCWERNGATPAKLDSFLVELLRPHFNPMEVLLAAAFLRDELLERVYPGLFTEEEFSARPG